MRRRGAAAAALLTALLLNGGIRLAADSVAARPAFAPYVRKLALVVGINRYRQGVRSLEYAVADAQAIADLLRKDLGFNEVTLLLDEEADREGILQALVDLKERAGAEDQVFFFFAGHGVSFGQGAQENGYLIPQDATGWREERVVAVQGISMIDLRDRLVRFPAKHVLVAIDACYGGLAASASRGLSAAAADYLDIVTRNRARQILTAGKRGQQVLENPAWGHSAFTYKLLDGLGRGAADANADGLVTATELDAYLSPAVTALTRGAQTPQFAELEPEDGEFVFLLPEARVWAEAKGGSSPQPLPATGLPEIDWGALSRLFQASDLRRGLCGDKEGLVFSARALKDFRNESLQLEVISFGAGREIARRPFTIRNFVERPVAWVPDQKGTACLELDSNVESIAFIE